MALQGDEVFASEAAAKKAFDVGRSTNLRQWSEKLTRLAELQATALREAPDSAAAPAAVTVPEAGEGTEERKAVLKERLIDTIKGWILASAAPGEEFQQAVKYQGWKERAALLATVAVTRALEELLDRSRDSA